MFEVVIRETREVKIKVPAVTDAEALKLISDEYFDNKYVLTDEDYDVVSVAFSCRKLQENGSIHSVEYD